mmetsp:Transcript_22917/g.38979  ORF Transcript_22917/g.38979 Transcript_22917/m.38979 type:complete len:97 (-) Transcript_22917:1327-1617(-)
MRMFEVSSDVAAATPRVLLPVTPPLFVIEATLNERRSAAPSDRPEGEPSVDDMSALPGDAASSKASTQRHCVSSAPSMCTNGAGVAPESISDASDR